MSFLSLEGYTFHHADTGDAVHHIVPAAILPYALGGEPPLVPAIDGALEVGYAGDENVDCDDDERERLEPVLCTDTPFVLDHHEADAPCGSRVELGIMEPALHVDMGLVLKRPLRAAAYSEPDGKEVDGEGQRDYEEHRDAAEFCTACEFIEEDEAQKDHQQHPPLSEGASSGLHSINLEEHRCWF